MRRYLVVANQTLVGSELMEIIQARSVTEEACFHIVVPATPVREKRVWTRGKAQALAKERLGDAIKRFADFGAEATGEVGDANPMAAIADCPWTVAFDGIILSTLPPGRSEWPRQDPSVPRGARLWRACDPRGGPSRARARQARPGRPCAEGAACRGSPGAASRS
jgi:hypothetical protein